MKILQLIQKQQLRGAEIFACQLSNQLVVAGHEVKMICLLEGPARLGFCGEMINLKRPLSKRLFDVRGWRMLAKEIAAFQPDIVQCNAGDTLKYAVVSKLIFRWAAPVVFRNASIISSYIKSPWVKGWNAFLFRQVSQVVSVTQKSKLDLLSLYPFMNGRVEVIPIGLEFAFEPESSEPASPYLLHVGGFTFEKNHERMLHIFKQVNNDIPGLELLLAGDGPLRPHIELKARELGLVDGVRFLGYQTNVSALMRKAKALLLPSIIEGLPGVMLEAMYGHTPVVAYDVGGIAEVVKSGETGWLVNAGDEAGFVEAIKQVLAKEGVDKITENAYAMVVKNFDNRVIAKRFLEAYERVILVNRRGAEAQSRMK